MSEQMNELKARLFDTQESLSNANTNFNALVGLVVDAVGFEGKSMDELVAVLKEMAEARKEVSPAEKAE